MTDTYQPTVEEPEPAEEPVEPANEAAPQKASQADANYRRGTPTKHCGVCVYYEGEDTKSCSQVEGPISGFGISDVFQMQSNPFGSQIGPREAAAMDSMMQYPPDQSPLVQGQQPTVRIGGKTY
jgi:hypothetical protein